MSSEEADTQAQVLQTEEGVQQIDEQVVEDSDTDNKRYPEEDTNEAPAKKAKMEHDGDSAAQPEGTEETPPRETGTVKWFDVKKGYGFLVRDQGAEDVFVHQSCIVNEPGMKGVAEDEKLEFFVTKETSGRLRANDITLVGGVTVKGQPDPAIAVPAAYTFPAPVVAEVQKPLPDHTTEDLPEGRCRGSIKWFDATKGFGFIIPSDGSDDVFVHQTTLSVAPAGYRSLAEGENVEYEVTQEQEPAKSKQKAINVTGPGGKCVPVYAAPQYAYPAQPAYSAPQQYAPQAQAAPADYSQQMTPEAYAQYQQQWAAYYAAQAQAPR